MSTPDYNRGFSTRLTRLAKHFPAVVLTGARQTGKTTLLRECFPDHTYVSLDLPGDAQLAEEDPAAFLLRYPPPLIVDEVQYAPGLFRHLKAAIDQKRQAHGRFILTGSQKFTLMKEVSDSLAGRVALLELETLAVSELAETFHAERKRMGLAAVLARGFFPALWADLELPRADFYRSYLATYIERDVRQILNIGSLRDFDRFMRVCATRTGQVVNKTDIAKDVGVSPKTIHEWLSVLQASNQLLLLEPYFANPGKRIVKSPKLYFADCGLACFLLGLDETSLPESPSYGAIWETFVYAELRKAIAFHRPDAALWYYRDQQVEVDFIIACGGKLHLAEAKSRALPNARDFQSADKVRPYYRTASPTTRVIAPAEHGYPFSAHQRVVSGFEIEALLKGL